MAAPSPTLALVAASQPDIVRASQKDDMYIEQYVEATREAMRRLLGPFRSLRYARETKLLALALYHGLTTGTGRATLGEEYCNMLQTTADGRAPDLRTRLLLALLQSLGPYLAESLAARLDTAADAAASEAEEAVAEAELRREMAVAAAAAGVQGEAGSGRGSREIEEEGEQGVWRDGGGGGGGGALAAAREAAARWRVECWRAVVRAWPSARPLMSYAGRLHLALFYVYGAYYGLAHRVAGVRYTLSSRPLQGRASYRVLGLLLGLQLAVVAGLQARRLAREAATAAAAAAKQKQQQQLGQQGGHGGGGWRLADEGEPAIMLDDIAGEGLPYEEYDGGEGDVVQGGGRDGRSVEGLGLGEDVGGAVGKAGMPASARPSVEGWEEVHHPHAQQRQHKQQLSRAGQGHLGGFWAGQQGQGHGEYDEHHDEEDGAGGGGGWEASVFGTTRPARGMAGEQPVEDRRGPGPQGPAVAAAGGASPAPTATGAAAGIVAATAPGEARGSGSGKGGQAAVVYAGPLPVLTSSRSCPLCLSPKSYPTSTPCGHTFCWSCIAAWCREKPECPLCRSGLRLQQLVCLYHTNC